MASNTSEEIIEAQTTGNDKQPATNPWEQSWNEVKEYVSNTKEAVNTAVSNVSKGGNPWEQDWSAKTKTVAPTAPQPKPQPLEAAPKFDTVFNNLVQVESKGRHFDDTGNLTTSSAGAKGITQVMEATASDPGYGVKPLQNNTKEEYIRFSKDYLNALLKEFHGDYEKALGAYNAGVGSVKKAITKAEEKGGEWKNYLPKKSETVPYINKILGKTNG